MDSPGRTAILVAVARGPATSSLARNLSNLSRTESRTAYSASADTATNATMSAQGIVNFRSYAGCGDAIGVPWSALRRQ